MPELHSSIGHGLRYLWVTKTIRSQFRTEFLELHGTLVVFLYIPVFPYSAKTCWVYSTRVGFFFPILPRMCLSSHIFFSVEHYWLGTILSRIKLLEHKSQSLHPIHLAIIQTLVIKPRTLLMAQRLDSIKMEWNGKWSKWKRWWVFTSLKVFSLWSIWVLVELNALLSTDC